MEAFGVKMDPAADISSAKTTGHAIPCIFQEPHFSPADIEFLQGLGHTVVRSPAAFRAVDADSLLFGVHLYRAVYAEALATSLPRIFVGTDWDTWATSSIDKIDWDAMETMDRTFHEVPFPRDEDEGIFHVTSIYWNQTSDSSERAKEVTAAN